MKSETWFQKVDTSGRITRSAANPLNLKPQAARLEIRRNFFSNKAVEGWNLIPSELKNARTVHFFKRAYRTHRAELVKSASKEMKTGSSQRRLPQLERDKTPTKRSYLDHRRSTYKYRYPSK